MAVPVEAIVDVLRGDTLLASMVGDHVFDRDIRRAGSGSTNAMIDPVTGSIYPSIMVDDAGGSASPFSPSSIVTRDRCDVWVFAPRSKAGGATVDMVVSRVIALLQRWQDSGTGVLLFYSDRLGRQETASPNESYMDRVTFSVNGVLTGAAW